MIGDEIIFKDSGSLEELGVADILMILYKKSATGMLRIEQKEIIKVIYLKEGNIAFASSNDPDDRLGEVLIKLKKITKEQLNDAMQRLKPNISLGKMLVQLGYLSGKDLLLGAQKQAESIITSVFSWEKGNYSFIEGPLPKQLVDLKLETPRVIVQGVMSNATKKWVLKHIISMEHIFKLKEGYRDVYNALQLSKDVDHIIEKLDGKRTLSEISATSNLEDFQICKIVASLIVLGIVEKIVKPAIDEEKIPEEIKPVEKIEEKELFEAKPEETLPEEEKIIKEQIIYEEEKIEKEELKEERAVEYAPVNKEEEIGLLMPEGIRHKRRLLSFIIPLSIIAFGVILLLLFWKLKTIQQFQSYFPSVITEKKPLTESTAKQQKNEVTIISIPTPKETKEIQVPKLIPPEEVPQEKMPKEKLPEEKPIIEIPTKEKEIEIKEPEILPKAVKIDKWKIAIDYLQQKKYIAAANTWKEIIKKTPSKLTIQIELACKEETIQEAYNLFSVNENFYIVPFKFKGNPCYIIGYGLFEDRKEAEQAYKELPSVFLNQKFPPKIIFASQIIK